MLSTCQMFDAIIDKYYGEITVRHEIGLELVQKCHPKSGLAARYFGGSILLTCKKCQSNLFEIVVAKE